MTIIKYTNDDDQPITGQQILILKFYKKHFFVDNELKKVERYAPKGRTSEIILKAIEYYLSDSEDLQSIIDQYKSTARILTIYNNKQFNTFGDTYYDLISFRDEILYFKTRIVTNIEGQLIAFCSINVETGEIADKRKSFYGDINIYKRMFVESSFLDVSYNDDNTISNIYIHDEDYQSVSEFLSSSFSADFDWMAHPYYHSFEPMLPTVPT